MYLFFLKDDEDSSDSDEDGQAFYAGGSETSGQQILGPAKKKDGADFVKHMFKKATLIMPELFSQFGANFFYTRAEPLSF